MSWVGWDIWSLESGVFLRGVEWMFWVWKISGDGFLCVCKEMISSLELLLLVFGLDLFIIWERNGEGRRIYMNGNESGM